MHYSESPYVGGQKIEIKINRSYDKIVVTRSHLVFITNRPKGHMAIEVLFNTRFALFFSFISQDMMRVGVKGFEGE